MNEEKRLPTIANWIAFRDPAPLLAISEFPLFTSQFTRVIGILMLRQCLIMARELVGMVQVRLRPVD